MQRGVTNTPIYSRPRHHHGPGTTIAAPIWPSIARLRSLAAGCCRRVACPGPISPKCVPSNGSICAAAPMHTSISLLHADNSSTVDDSQAMARLISGTIPPVSNQGPTPKCQIGIDNSSTALP